MGFVGFLVGKRILEDDFQRGINAWASTPKATARRYKKLWPQWLASATAELSPPGVLWSEAGVISADRSGVVVPPSLPASPGVIRLDISGPNFMDYAVMLTIHESLRASEAAWANDAELANLLRTGAMVRVFYVPTSNGHALTKQAEAHAPQLGYWILHETSEGRVLLANPLGDY